MTVTEYFLVGSFASWIVALGGLRSRTVNSKPFDSAQSASLVP